MATFNLQETGAYLEDFVNNLAAFCEAYRNDLAVSSTQPIRGIYRSAPLSHKPPELAIPSYPGLILIPLGWEEESQTTAERYLRLRVELLLFYSGLHEGQRLSVLLGWADKITHIFMEHRQDWRGSGPSPYLHDLLFTPLELLEADGSKSCGKIMVVGLKRVKK